MSRAVASAAIVVCAAACGHPARRDPGGPHNAVAAGPSDAAPPDADDCTLDRGAIESLLNHTGAGITTTQAAVFDPEERHLHEAIALSDGTRIAFAIGGCAHFAWELVYDVPAIGTTDVERLIDRAEALLRGTPINGGLAIDMADRIRARSRTAPRAANGPWSIECGDANCEVDAQVNGSALRIIVSYDFPL